MPRCINGVCLDNLCYCNDGFGGKGCEMPDIVTMYEDSSWNEHISSHLCSQQSQYRVNTSWNISIHDVGSA
ncbi:hypothetical protein CEXT_249211 [Caerostris extrusa]|uniref:EGF-like domain-containing protein n=1 Tax=Caerostris extrusa TaxID=172846 RepID=A0AAV4VCV6_CAEEX|nr:hypothetical protein CEXT_249211 [Caerostris extrusa]